MYADLTHAITNFVEFHHHTRPRQKTEAWYRNRKREIGGSELSALMGVNPFQSFTDIIASKTGLRENKINLATRWGIFFEPVAQLFLEIDCNTHVLGTDINVPAPFPGHSNSPDGYCVASFNS